MITDDQTSRMFSVNDSRLYMWQNLAALTVELNEVHETHMYAKTAHKANTQSWYCDIIFTTAAFHKFTLKKLIQDHTTLHATPVNEIKPDYSISHKQMGVLKAVSTSEVLLKISRPELRLHKQRPDWHEV